MSDLNPSTSANEVSILSGIPLPENADRTKYPWKTMAIGESFFVPGGKLTTFATTCNKNGHKYNRAFIARKYTRDGVEGIMVWRKA